MGYLDGLAVLAGVMPLAGVVVHRLTEGRRSLRRNITLAGAYCALLGLSYGTHHVLHVYRCEVVVLHVVFGFLLILSPIVGLCIAVAPPVERSGRIVLRCHVCGYNLTGNVSGRCPECGTPVDLLKQ